MPQRVYHLAQIGTQQERILLLSLFIIKHEKGIRESRPHASKVLNIIKFRNLMVIRPSDEELVENGSEKLWQNRLRFQHSNLKERGWMRRGSGDGHWEISPAGEQEIVNWCGYLRTWKDKHEDWESRLSPNFYANPNATTVDLSDFFDADETILDEENQRRTGMIIICSQTVEEAIRVLEMAALLSPPILPNLIETMIGKFPIGYGRPRVRES